MKVRKQQMKDLRKIKIKYDCRKKEQNNENINYPNGYSKYFQFLYRKVKQKVF